MFWKFADGSPPPGAGLDLVYEERFLKEYTPWANELEPYPLKPELVRMGPTPSLTEHISIAATRGICCPRCGRCSSRLKWTHWECQNPTCSFTHSIPMPVIPASFLPNPFFPPALGYSLYRDQFKAPVQLSFEFKHNYRIARYTIPGIEGSVSHFIANKAVVEEPGGPNDMFEELQHVDIGLERRRMENGQGEF